MQWGQWLLREWDACGIDKGLFICHGGVGEETPSMLVRLSAEVHLLNHSLLKVKKKLNSGKTKGDSK